MKRSIAVKLYVAGHTDFGLGFLLRNNGIEIFPEENKTTRVWAEKIAYRMIMDGEICD